MGGGGSKQKKGTSSTTAPATDPVQVEDPVPAEDPATPTERTTTDTDDDKDVAQPSTYKVTFTRDGSLGINLMARTPTEPRVFVKSLSEIGQAADLQSTMTTLGDSTAQQIRPGHLLVGIDGDDVRMLNIAQVFARIAGCGRPCTIEFKPASDDFAVKLMPGEGKFGARIVNYKDKVRIDAVYPGMSAQEHGVCVGDWISQVGDERITSQGAKRTFELITNAPRPLIMILARGNEAQTQQRRDGVMSQEQLDALLVDALEEEMKESAAHQEEILKQQKSASKNRIAERLRIRKALKDQTAILRATPFFSELQSDSALHAIVDGMHYRKCAGGQNLVSEGDDANEFLVIVEGLACCKRKGVAGEVSRLQAHDVFGIAAVTGAEGSNVRNATVTAIKTCHLLVLTRSKYNAFRADGTINLETHNKALQMASEYAKADAARPAIEIENGAGDEMQAHQQLASQMQKQAEEALRKVSAEEKNMTQEEIAARDADIVAEIEKTATQEAEKLRERSAKMQASSASRVQERLKARNALKHSNLLSSTNMFNGLSADKMNAVVDAMEFRLVHAGQNICTQGDEANSMIVITSGRAELRKKLGSGDEGEERVLGEIGATATIGEPCLLPGDHLRTATVIALEPTCVLLLTRCKYSALLDKGVLSRKESLQRVKTSAKKIAIEDAKRLASLLNGAPSGEVVVGGI